MLAARQRGLNADSAESGLPGKLRGLRAPGRATPRRAAPRLHADILLQLNSSDDNPDLATFAAHAISRCSEIVEQVHRLLAHELLYAALCIDRRLDTKHDPPSGTSARPRSLGYARAFPANTRCG